MKKTNEKKAAEKRTVNQSMKLKLVLTFLSMNIITLLAIILVIGFMSYGIISSENNQKLINISEKNSNEIDGWLSIQGQIVYEIADSITSQKELDKEQILLYLETKTKSNPYTSDVYFGFADKSFLDGSGWQPPADYDCTTRAWFQNAKEKGDLYYGSPSFDMTTEQMVTVISKPIIIDGNFIGVIGMDVKLGTLNEIVQKSVSTKNSYAFMVDEQDNIMIHQNDDFMPKEDKISNLNDVLHLASKDVIQNIENNNQLATLKDYDGNMRHFVMTNIKSTNWKFGLAISDAEYIKPVKDLLTALIICSLITILIVAVIAVFVGDKNSKPIISLTAAIKKQADLDFSRDSEADFMKYGKRKDEIGIITNSLITMEENVRQLLISAADNANQVSATAEELSSTAKQSAIASQEVAQTINQIAVGATEQAENTEESSQGLLELGNLIDTDKTHIANLTKETNHVNELVQDGLAAVKTLSLNTKTNGEAVSVAYQSILKTSESSEKISEASDFITSVAEQTNLLALNAAIEAARAGENGRGFAVVAEEIRRLAEQSTDSTKIINEIVHSLKEAAATAVTKMEEADALVKEQTVSVGVTETNFNDIALAMTNAKEAVNVLNQSSSRMKDRKDEIFDLIQNLSASAEENAAATEEASAAMEEEYASSEEIANASENLTKITSELQMLINRFRI
ncbi:hypothetical protein Ana3638_08260 [Anaerocolumna sedimenticola]|uniref:Methyl-accepting transducer domain-containing protein n=1 Tax=Anaerocolumna sedimenticola TaxID=2696063 RepID=A0A6P1TM66_9FIRM|nr:methyl-accepting chemotaxis protein [Anaerocolumna sedimenticola]QHQ60765.1 hypothetical protein Ana3638_08260 [Anaerocolumna sedimenticola]